MSETQQSHEKSYFHYRGRRSVEKKASRFMTMATQIVLIATLVMVMLLWGGRHPMATGALGIGVMIAFICWAFSLALRGRWIWRKAGGLWLFLLAILLGALQLSPDVSSALMTDELKGLYAQSAATGLFKGDFLLAVIPSVQWESLQILLGVGLWYALARQVFDTDRKALVWFTLGLAGVALMAGVLGILQRFADYEWIGPVWMRPSISVAATWINKNHFGQFEAMGLMLSLGLLTSFVRAKKGSTVEKLFSPTMRKGIVIFAALTAIVCALGVLFSISRTATMLAGVALLLFFVYLIRYQLRTGFGPVALGLLFIGFMVLVGGDYALSRLEYGLSGEDASGLVRFQIWKTALSVIMLAPLTGTGFAAIRGLSSHFDTSYMPGYVTFDAHNDYLDIAAIFGIPFAAVVILWVLGHFLWAAVRVLKARETHSSLHAIVVGAWLALFCALGHEVMDYGFKHEPNLLMALGIAVVMTGMLRRLYTEEKTVKTGHWSTAAEKEGLRVGRLFYAFPALATALAAVGLNVYADTYRVGDAYADLENLRQVPSIRAAFSNERWLKAMTSRAVSLEKLDPTQLQAWEVKGLAEVRLAGAQSTDVMASAMSRVLDREVSTGQVWREPYRPYREKAFYQILPEELTLVADTYGRAANALQTAFTLDPMNGSTLSRLAKARDDEASWRREFTSSLALHEAALAIYPSNADVMRNAIDGFWHAWQETNEKTAKDKYETRLITVSRDFGAQVPYRLREIYPLVWSVKPDVALLEELTPEDISALEELGRFFVTKEENRAALKAYRSVLSVNDARADVETVETIGDLEFLRRERRTKVELARMTWEKIAGVYERLNQPEEVREAEAEVKALLFIERTPVIARIDAALKDSHYALAEAEILQIKDDVRAKIRMAEIMLMSGRYEGLRHWVADIKAIVENDKFPAGEDKRFDRVLEKMRGLGIAIPDAHEFDLPEDFEDEKSR